jgi:hypothetical protein
MMNQQAVTDEHASTKSVVERCESASSALARLSLSSEQLDALRTQGFVHVQRRAGGKSCFKLRFRFRGKQLVRYLGNDPLRAEQIRDALAQHQIVHRKLRRLARDTQQANRMVREAKKKLLPYVERLGYKFHGFDLRMQRGAEPHGKEASHAPASSHHFVTDNDLNPMENVNNARNDDEKDCKCGFAARGGDGGAAGVRWVRCNEQPATRGHRNCQTADDATSRIPHGLPCPSQCRGGDARNDSRRSHESSVSAKRFNRRGARRGFRQQKGERVADLGNRSLDTCKSAYRKTYKLKDTLVECAERFEAAYRQPEIALDRCLSTVRIRYHSQETGSARCRGPPVNQTRVMPESMQLVRAPGSFEC